MAISHGDELRDNLARLLKANDKRTLGYLEKKAGVDRSVISRILSYETKNPQLKTIMKLERAIHEIESNDADRVRKSPIDSRVRETISAATKSESSKDKDKDGKAARKHLDETQKYAITRSAFTAHVYSFISANNGKRKIFPKDILEKFGHHHKPELDHLIDSRVLVVDESDGHLVPEISNIAIEDSYFFLKLARADLDYFDSEAIGTAAALARRNGTTSQEGIDEIRSIIYDALVKIAAVPNTHKGDIAFHTNMFANVYNREHFMSASGDEGGKDDAKNKKKKTQK